MRRRVLNRRPANLLPSNPGSDASLLKYIRDYQTSIGLKSPRWENLPAYHWLLERILFEESELPLVEKQPSECIKRAVAGKVFLEVGCRSGLFLRFLLDHGAQVVGCTTGKRGVRKYYNNARRILGNDAQLEESFAADADQKLAGVNPHYLLSLNLFDNNRWEWTRCPRKKIIRALARIAGPRTIVLIHPTTDSGKSKLDETHLRKMGLRPRVRNRWFPLRKTYAFKVQRVL